MTARSAARALLLGADDSLASLLSDVLGELGIALDLGKPGAVRPDLVLAHADRRESIRGVMQQARACAALVPIIMLVPFADERLVQLALQHGARDCFALGRPLAELRHLLLEQVPGLGRSRLPPEEKDG